SSLLSLPERGTRHDDRPPRASDDPAPAPDPRGENGAGSDRTLPSYCAAADDGLPRPEPAGAPPQPVPDHARPGQRAQARAGGQGEPPGPQKPPLRTEGGDPRPRPPRAREPAVAGPARLGGVPLAFPLCVGYVAARYTSTSEGPHHDPIPGVRPGGAAPAP